MAIAGLEKEWKPSPVIAPGLKLVKVGAVFDPATRTLGEWIAM